MTRDRSVGADPGCLQGGGGGGGVARNILNGGNRETHAI